MFHASPHEEDLMVRGAGHHWIAAVAVGFFAGVTFCPADAADLSPQELKGALGRIQSSAAFRKAAAHKGDTRMYVAATSKNPGIVEVLYFKYEGGVTIRAAMDARSGE